jgi:acetyl-CoA acetyltransferase family protein
MNEIVVLGGARTPFGRFGGGLKSFSPTQLGTLAAKAALARSGVEPGRVDNAVIGNVIQTGDDYCYMARHVALETGISTEAPALTVNRLCGSGLQAVVSAAQSICLGESRLALAGGTETMSQAPYVLRDRFGAGLGTPALQDTLWEALTDTYCGCGMAITAENIAERHGIAREEQDAFALLSQQRTAAAVAAGLLAEEIVPVQVRQGRQVQTVEQDEHPRPDVTAESLAKLPARFRENGTVTAGNASGINDGAAMLLLADGAEAERLGLKPLGRILSWGVAGVEPAVMGLGPVPAGRLALARAGLTVEQLDLVEVNEAFAVQYLAVERLLGLDRMRTNVNGGAIALGHPVGASGARLLLTLLLQLRRRGGRYGMAALCIGGGQGIAAVVEAF